MRSTEENEKKEWRKPAFESLKFSQTLGGTKRGFLETSTLGNGKFNGTIS